ncbi:MAG: thiamine pyrophosphate-dependent enzyme [Kiritimatiellae bacterium]|nr:alpha-keto acid decarboxylase family protein [Verrucomicrobiota bacterium]MCG2658632.1 thiamine pyrophosphate-dependent enzyme [Kiritimatiellia bacterium]
MVENNGLTCTLSRYLLHRLQEAGIGHLFGVPGDYVLDFLDAVIASPIQWVGTCNELNAGYAADGYARLNGAGAAVVTYCVGGFSILNAVAGAYAERVPLIVISGAPPARRREAGALVHHLVSDYYLQLDIFKKVTIDAAILTNPETAPDEIDRVIRNGILHKLPVYLELPADMAHTPCRQPSPLTHAITLHTDEENLKSCLQEAVGLLNRAGSPIVLVGVELLRFGLGSSLLQLVEGLELPFATMLSSKSVLPELHPQFIGIYQGGWSRETVRRQVESSDCLLSLGVWMTDMDTGMFSDNLDNRRMIVAGNGQVSIGDHNYRNVQLGDFIRGLMTGVQPRSYLTSHPVESYHARVPFIPEASRKLTALRLYERLNTFLDDRMILLAEPGDAFCAALDFHIEEAENFIVQAFYTSIGYCTPAALGVAFARPSKRPVVLTGDGAFQMTAQELSTLIRQRCPAIILLINNDGYLVERVLHEDGPYNDIQMWNYADLPSALGGGAHAVGIRVTTEGELEHALTSAAKEQDRLSLIELCLPDRDCSVGLKRLGDAFRKKG